MIVNKPKSNRQLVDNLLSISCRKPLLSMEMIVKILNYLKPKPLWVKILAVSIITALAVVLFCSCGTTQKLPDLSDYKVGAEGVVSKEKTTTKQTKWYFKPDSIESQYE